MTLSINSFGASSRVAEDAQRLVLYRATAERLEKQILEISRLRSTLPRALLAGLGVALVAIFFHWAAALFFLIAGVSTYGVGTYIASIHIAEDTSALDEVRHVIATLDPTLGMPDEPARTAG